MVTCSNRRCCFTHVQCPSWVNQTVILLLALGLPITLVLAWAYELSLEGVRRDSGETSGVGNPATSIQRVNSLLLGFMVLAVCFLLFDRFFLEPVQTVSRGNGSGTLNDPLVVRSSLNLGIMDQQLGTRLFSEIAMSPDGSKLVFTRLNGQTRELFYRELDQFDATVVAEYPTANGALMPVFSEDGDKVAVIEGEDPIAGELIVYSTTGQRIDTGVGQVLGTGVQWLDERNIVYTSYVDYKLYRVNIDSLGDPPVRIEFEHRGGATQPEFLPGGNAALFVESRESIGLVNQGDIFVADLSTGESRLPCALSLQP